MKKIKFVTSNKLAQEVIPMPKPAKFYIPDWYKDSKSFSDGNNTILDKHGNKNSTLKVCMPFFDIMTYGYIQETWCDIHISLNDGVVNYYYSYAENSLNIMSSRPIDALQNFPIPDDCYPVFFHWAREWNAVLPKGYSAIITHPQHRDDLPFRTISAIIDYDGYHLSGKVGFFIKKDFNGIIPKGTPMYQIIPFKKDSWESEKIIFDEKYNSIFQNQFYNIRSKFTGGYKKNYWNRKEFK